MKNPLSPMRLSLGLVVLLVLPAAIPISIAFCEEPPKGDESNSTKAAVKPEKASQSTAITPDQVIAAWQDREKRVTAFRFNCLQKSTIPKGTRRTLGIGKIPGGIKFPPFPPTDTVTTAEYTFLLQGKNTFYSNRGDVLSPTGAFTPDDYSCSYDGTECRTLYTNSGIGQLPKGHISNDDTTIRQSNAVLMLIYRPFRYLRHEHGLKEIPRLSIGECRTVPIPKGTVTITFSLPADERIKTYVAVDPSREYLPVSYVHEYDKKLKSVLSIEYRQDPIQGWVPKSWGLRVFTFEGALMGIKEGTVLKCDVNTPIPAHDFEVVFPKGT
jgi:hypothetical protein